MISSTWHLLGGFRDGSCLINTIAMLPSGSAYHATAECRLGDHVIIVTARNNGDGSISNGKRTAWKPVACYDWQHISMTVYLAICRVLLHTAAGL